MPAAHPSLRSPWLRKLVVVGGVLVGANLLLGVVGRGLPEPVRYPTREIQLTVERLDDATADGCRDVLVTGNSVAAEALSAQGLAEAWGLESGVVSVLPGSIATVDVDWMERVTLPRARPGTLVYVASPLTFVPEELADSYGLGIYTRAVATRSGWAGDLHRWAVDHLPLAKYRLTLADFEALVRDLQGDLPTDYGDVVEALGWEIDPDGHIRSEGTWDHSEPILDAVADAAELVGDQWRIDPEQAAGLRDEFSHLVQQGMKVVVVIPPVTADLRRVFPGGEAGFAEYVDRARSLGDGEDVVVVDLAGEPFPDELFRDTHHLNEQGAELLTGQVAEALAGADLPGCREVGSPRGRFLD